MADFKGSAHPLQALSLNCQNKVKGSHEILCLQLAPPLTPNPVYAPDIITGNMQMISICRKTFTDLNANDFCLIDRIGIPNR